MIDVYAQNTTLSHPSIQDSHLVLRELHAHFPGGLADRESPWNRGHERHQQRVSKKPHEQTRITEDARWVKNFLKYHGLPCNETVAKLFSEICYHLEKEVAKGYDNVTLDCTFLMEKLERCLSSLSTYTRALEKAGLFYITWFRKGKNTYCSRIRFTLTPLLMTLIEDTEKNWACLRRLQNLHRSQLKYYEILQEKLKLSTILEETAYPILQHSKIDISFTREKSVTENKNVTETAEKEKKAASGSETSSATSEQPKDPIAIKLTECEATPEPSFQTPTKSPESKEDRQQKQETITTNTPKGRKALADRKKAEREKKREEARKHGYRKLRKPEIEDMIQQAWVYFVFLFQPEGSAPSWACTELDFKTCLSAKIPRLFYGIEGFKKYLDAIFTNEYLMGRRRMSNGNFWVLQLGAMFYEKTYDQYLNQSGLFRPSNYIVFSKKEEASVPKDMLEKLNFSQDQLSTVCEVVNDHLQHLEAQLVDKSASPLTTQQLEKLMMNRPVKDTSIPSESSEKAEESHEVNKTTQGEEKLLGDVSSPFDEKIKKHLLKELPYSTYKAWIVDTRAFFEDLGKSWNVMAKGRFCEGQIRQKFESLIHQAVLCEAPKEPVVKPSISAEVPARPSIASSSAVPQAQKKTFYAGDYRRILNSFLFLFWMLSGIAQAVEIKSCFTPQQQCLPLIVHELNNARSEILMQAYSFTSKPISKALREAHDRGVKVKILIDPSQEKSPHSQVGLLKGSGIDVMVDDKVRIAHNKVIVIDGKTLIGGSYNFSAAAEKHNAENLIIVKDDPVVQE